jgi:hypothetical protein
MSEKKSITIDSSSLMGGGDTLKKKSTRRKSVGSGEHRIRPSSIVQPSTLKKTLLERIKQHQRTRERSRDKPDAVAETAAGAGAGARTEPAGDIFSQSIDFLRKLAMKRRQQTQKRHSSSAASSSSSSLPEAKTPEAQMLNKVAETLHNGEILTNTGLLGLPVVPTLVQPTVSPELLMNTTTAPLLNLIPNTISGITETPQLLPPTPKLTELADMYNNTVAAAPLTDAITDATAAEANTSASEKSSSAAAASTYVPTKIEDFMPSIFIKEEPPHGCLKNGKKPTFREWASKLFGGGGDSGDNGDTGSTNQDPVSVTSVNGGGSKSAAVEDVRDITGMRVKIRKTHKKRFRIGKHDNVVGVLLKNKQTQRHIQSQHLTLKQKSIGEIRKHLYDHHLLKIGSNAPPDVLRRMYEDSILTGDVKNTNDGVLLHNFMSGGGE